VSERRTGEPLQVIEASGKLRNGLFLRGISLYDDRIAFEVFASRALRAEELATLRLADDAGTSYEMVPPAGAVDGRASIEFKPAPPVGFSQLHLSEPGWGLRVLNGLA
jgi:hypothetical protein